MRESIALSVVIPAYNEAARLPATLRDLRAFLDRDGRRAEVIVVDDGSTDGTSEVVRRAEAEDDRIRLIRLPQNRGKGYAVRTGVVNAAGRLVLFADADGATPFQELARLESHLAEGARIAIGSRGIHDRARRSRPASIAESPGESSMPSYACTRFGIHRHAMRLQALRLSRRARPLLANANERLQLRRRGAAHGAALGLPGRRGPRELDAPAGLEGPRHPRRSADGRRRDADSRERAARASTTARTSRCRNPRS